MSRTGYTRAKLVAHTASTIQRIELELAGPFDHHAGQYLGISLAGEPDLLMSIASPPQWLPRVELHYQPTPGDPQSQALDTLLLAAADLYLSPPMGEVCAPLDDRLCLLIAGGSGASQAFAIARDRAHHQRQSHTHVLWCVDDDAQLYAVQELQGLAQLKVVVDDQRSAANEGLMWLKDQHHRYRGAHIIICGSPAFVYAVSDVLLGLGFSREQLQADAYSYAPRD